MKTSILWLPDLIKFSSYKGNWPNYVDAIYEIFVNDFIETKPIFRGKRLGLKRHPLHDGKESTFWHLISEGRVEAERTPDLRRCERIGWPSPTINNSHEELHLKVWSTFRNKEERITIWIESQDYVVILAVRKGYILPWTAYPITYRHEKAKLEKSFKKAGPTKADAAQRAAS